MFLSRMPGFDCTHTSSAAPTVTPMIRRPPFCDRNNSMMAEQATAKNDSNRHKPRRAITSAVRLGNT